MYTLLAAIAALTLIQVADWIRDMRLRGLGADGVKDLMVAPYRRIVVLHLTILAGGFALTALEEPLAGLIILVAVKTASDVWHWKRDNGVAFDIGEQGNFVARGFIDRTFRAADQNVRLETDRTQLFD